ncbi:unnamed protein product [Fraxinus pennsylvanica]|uniref:cAMP-regulated phosphoprotein 19-related protein n=1 Tax=Fraxinus pennsylvanica TaxID=56036 RepID=A0AAD1ZGX1_9LAMI|nr:unnamed protein product [Fraxinus pennsylvanica]
MSGTEEVNAQTDVMESSKPMPSTQQDEEAIKKKYGGIMPKKPPLISKDHERAYFDSADWALGKQGVEKPKGPLEALRPKLQILKKSHLLFNLSTGWSWRTSSVAGPIGVGGVVGGVGGGEVEQELHSLAFILPTQQQTRYRKSLCAPAKDEDGNAAPPEDAAANE